MTNMYALDGLYSKQAVLLVPDETPIYHKTVFNVC